MFLQHWHKTFCVVMNCLYGRLIPQWLQVLFNFDQEKAKLQLSESIKCLTQKSSKLEKEREIQLQWEFEVIKFSVFWPQKHTVRNWNIVDWYKP